MRGQRRRSALALGLAAAAATSAVLLPAPTAATAADGDELVTTPSTAVAGWSDQGQPVRHPDDLADPAVNDALKDWRLRVSQTDDLLNQTVQVSWESEAEGGFLQLMQCWSDGPDVPPTREQCAYGGIDREGSQGSGAGRTRALSEDARETAYLYDGDLNVLTVDGAVPPPRWPGSAELVLGTNQQTCPTGTTGYSVELAPPRSAVVEKGLPTIVAVGSGTGMPDSLTRQEGSFTRRYASVTPPFRLSAAPGGAEYPLGEYRVQLDCLRVEGATTTTEARFVGYLERAEVAGARIWRRAFREGGAFVPFDPLGTTPDTAPTDAYTRDEVLEYIKPRSTNEIWQARVRSDGGGSAFMEMLTDLEAQHLGCGRVDAGQARSCWLVAVPRWTPEPDGRQIDLPTLYSPLSQSLWDRRIQVPLRFAPVATGCRIGSGLKQVLAHDSALAVLRSWQPTFCDDPDTASSVLGPLQDFAIRAGVSQPNRMGVVTTPEPGLPTVVTAPIATSGVVVGFVADRQIPFGDPDYARNETRATVMNLTPRLVAKLLTQSYDSGAAPNGGKTSGYNGSSFSGGFSATFTPARSFPSDNPRTLYGDKEFLRLNPDFAAWLNTGANLVSPADMADVLVAANDTDAYQVLWRWVLGDPEARAFLDGTPDPDGMLVNPYYKGQITQDTSSFPSLDPTCVDNIQEPAADDFPLLCQLNLHPRVEDDNDAAQAAVRGDTKRINVAPLVFSGALDELTYKAEGRQPAGRAGMLVITTSGVAERYGLPTARLQNADGRFVAATSSSLRAARDQMPVREDGVLTAAPAAVGGDGYPLTTNSYAIVDVATTTQAQNNAFAAILSYAAGDGQRPGTAAGQLPPGYAPLSTVLAGQTRAAAALLRDPSRLLVQPESEEEQDVPAPPAAVEAADQEVPPPTPDSPAPADLAAASAPAPPVAADSGLEESAGSGPVAPVAAGAVAPPAGGDAPAPAVAAPASSTSGPSSGALGWALPALALFALTAAAGGRVLSTLARRAS